MDAILQERELAGPGMSHDTRKQHLAEEGGKQCCATAGHSGAGGGAHENQVSVKAGHGFL